MKRFVGPVVAIACILVSGTVLAKDRHPNLSAAHSGIESARSALSAAQSANEWDLGGHAAAAKSLLDQAAGEVAAARAAAK